MYTTCEKLKQDKNKTHEIIQCKHVFFFNLCDMNVTENYLRKEMFCLFDVQI